MSSAAHDDGSTLFELLPIGAYRSSVDGRQLRANPALVRLNGYDSEEQMLRSVNDIGREWYVEPGRRERFQQVMHRDGMVTDFVSEVRRHRTRERIWIRENAHVVRDAAGQALYYEGTVEDITAARRAELALQASEQRFRAFTERSQVLTVVCDADGRITYASPAAQRLLGVPAEAMVRSSVFDWLHPDDVASAHVELGRTLDAERAEGPESIYRARHADGQWRHLAVLSKDFRTVPGVGGIVLNARDVSGRTRAERALQQLNAELEQRVQLRTAELMQARDEAESANRAKSDFLSRMSHELRTPMHAILGFGRLLRDDAALAPSQRVQVHEMLCAAETLLRLIDQLLEVARAEPGAQPAQTADTGAPMGTVLYIEDNPVNVMLMEAMLAQQPGLRFISATLPEAGLHLARTERPRLVLLDIQLPGIDGYEVLRRLRADEATRATPVIAISANAMDADVARGRAAGFDDYLTKPLDQLVLLESVRRALSR